MGLPRKDLHYYITVPTRGINADTGLVMSVCGYGDMADSSYQTEKLRPYLADEHNLIAVGVNYHGIDRTQISLRSLNTDKFCEIYGYPSSIFWDEKGRQRPINDKLYIMYSILSQKNISQLDLRCTPCFSPVEYSSFGFLPAIDNLHVLGHVLKRYDINTSKIIAFGSSYGGYIASLMGKYAPHSFSVIIDNSGFPRAKIADILSRELLMDTFSFGGVKIGDAVFPLNGTLAYPWTIMDETSSYYFSDSHRSIRSLTEEEHRISSETRYFIFHSIQDRLVPINDKDVVVDMLRRYNQVYYKRITPSDIDGKVFKSRGHGMDASLKGLFRIVAQNDIGGLAKGGYYTDFSLRSRNSFHCGKKKYIFRFTEDYCLQVRIDEVPQRSSLNSYELQHAEERRFDQ